MHVVNKAATLTALRARPAIPSAAPDMIDNVTHHKQSYDSPNNLRVKLSWKIFYRRLWKEGFDISSRKLDEAVLGGLASLSPHYPVSH